VRGGPFVVRRPPAGRRTTVCRERGGRRACWAVRRWRMALLRT
jgi:hypothetical protein